MLAITSAILLAALVIVLIPVVCQEIVTRANDAADERGIAKLEAEALAARQHGPWGSRP